MNYTTEQLDVIIRDLKNCDCVHHIHTFAIEILTQVRDGEYISEDEHCNRYDEAIKEIADLKKQLAERCERHSQAIKDSISKIQELEKQLSEKFMTAEEVENMLLEIGLDDETQYHSELKSKELASALIRLPRKGKESPNYIKTRATVEKYKEALEAIIKYMYSEPNTYSHGLYTIASQALTNGSKEEK
jgi:predicted nuclease with TOPRIM domain